MFVNKAGAHLRVDHLGRLLAFPTNIGLFWKGMPGTNTLAYYYVLQKFVNYSRKKFYNIGPRDL
jgi:hypothetical protein